MTADLPKTPPDLYVGEVGGVGANSKGLIFVYTRTGHPYATLGDNRTFSRGGSRLLVFDGNGKFLREWGQDAYGFNNAIGLRVDPQDNVWTIDAGANQVVKFDAEGRIALVLGRKPETIGVKGGAARCAGCARCRCAGCTRCTRCSGATRAGIRNSWIVVQSTHRRRLGSGGQHLCRRWHRQQQSHRQVSTRKALSSGTGDRRDRGRNNSTASRRWPSMRKATTMPRRRQKAAPGVRC